MDLLLILFAVGFLNKATYILPICLFVAAWKESLKVKIEGFENLLILGAFSLACYCSMFLIGGSNNLNLFLPPVAYCVGNMYHSRKSTPVRRIIFIFAYAMA